MGRGPCCEKMGLKKGPWTAEEDEILINYIHLYGHSNWRALPKLAGLLRCGKSCRLRWTNYLRPDIKRGNFSREEEDTIINLHQILGNKWSAIAARLPGRTDNEIKNMWHTHLKKRVIHDHSTPQSSKRSHNIDINRSKHNDMNTDVSSGTASDNYGHENYHEFRKVVDTAENLPQTDDNIWAEVLSADNSDDIYGNDFWALGTSEHRLQFPLTIHESSVGDFGSNMNESIGFW